MTRNKVKVPTISDNQEEWDTKYCVFEDGYMVAIFPQRTRYLIESFVMELTGHVTIQTRTVQIGRVRK